MDVTITFDPANAAELGAARRVLDAFQDQSVALETEPARPIEEIIAEIASSDYGTTRLRFLAAITEAGEDGLDIERAKEELFDGSHQSYGGLRASIERRWAGSGGHAHAPHLISERHGRHYLLPEAVPLVRDALARTAEAKRGDAA